jgi:hypothetical protein
MEDEGWDASTTSQQMFDHSTVRDNARAHFGNSYQNFYRTVYQSTASDTSSAGGTLGCKIREALKFDGMDMRRATIKLPHGSSCQWFFDSPEYQKWRDNTFLEKHHGFLWIRGKPGAGKSTLMRLAVKHADRRFPDDLRISFFFNAKGPLLERSIEGMYRSLLHQLLVQCPTLESHFHQVGLIHPTWPLELLEEQFRDCILGLGTRTLTCHVDALDECEESDVRGLVESFEDLGSMAVSAGVQMHVCFASRHYPRISISRCVHLVLDKLEGHQQDIETYVRNNLKISEPALRDQFAGEIRARARDIFLWVVLVVRLLNKESDQGNSHNLRAQLDAIPSGLHDLFENDIIERGIDDSRFLLPILLWILSATRPLTPSELYHAVLFSKNDMNGAAVLNHTPDLSQIERFILNTSKGLAEITFTASKLKKIQPRVQFIHETVREHLLNSGISRLETSFCNNPTGMSHDFLKSRCVEYVSLAGPIVQRREELLAHSSDNIRKDLRDFIDDTYPFLEYAVERLVIHAEVAQVHGVSQVSFLDAFPLDLVVNLSNLIDGRYSHDTDKYYPFATKTYIFACLGAPRLLQLELNIPKGGGEHQSHVDAGVIDTADSGAILNSLQGNRGSPLHAAISMRHFSTIKLLLEHGSDVNAKGGTFGTALEVAAYFNCDLDIVELLFQYGADVTVRGDGEIALHLAVGEANVGMVRLLLGHGADVNAEGGTTGSALQRACSRGNLEVVKCLVEHGADVNAKGVKDVYGRCTALQAARRRARLRGNQEIADYLLEHGARDDPWSWESRQ